MTGEELASHFSEKTRHEKAIQDVVKIAESAIRDFYPEHYAYSSKLKLVEYWIDGTDVCIRFEYHSNTGTESYTHHLPVSIVVTSYASISNYLKAQVAGEEEKKRCAFRDKRKEVYLKLKQEFDPDNPQAIDKPENLDIPQEIIDGI